jgi:hypothetical protein
LSCRSALHNAGVIIREGADLNGLHWSAAYLARPATRLMVAARTTAPNR